MKWHFFIVIIMFRIFYTFVYVKFTYTFLSVMFFLHVWCVWTLQFVNWWEIFSFELSFEFGMSILLFTDILQNESSTWQSYYLLHYNNLSYCKKRMEFWIKIQQLYYQVICTINIIGMWPKYNILHRIYRYVTIK